MTVEALIEKVRLYNSGTDADLIRRAYDFAKQMHGDQKRDSGQGYITHPLAVAETLAEHMQADQVIAAGLLHDLVEDTDATTDGLAKLFDRRIATIVNGVTKVKAELEDGARNTNDFGEFMRSKNYRKFVSAAGRYNDVMMVKCADRLHNLRTSRYIAIDKRISKARETLDVYAPLAEMCGFQRICRELEDAAFGILQPEERAEIMRRFVVLRGLKQEPSPETVAAEEFHAKLHRKLEAAKIQAELSGRLKSPYSIWRKYRSSVANAELSGGELRPVQEWIGSIFDVFGFRIVTENTEDAYQALRIVHTNWRALPMRFKDYISTPKEPNKYQAIHTTVELPVTGAVEVQIRTAEMHIHAEFGSAAHWAYRNGLVLKENETNSENALQVLIDETMVSGKGEISDTEFKKKFSRAVTVKQISIACYTPKGRMIRLPSDSTALDFAFSVHSKLGVRAVAARIRGRKVELGTVLSDGDRVEILTAVDATPSEEWLGLAKTARAKAEIRRALHQQERKHLISLGLKIADEALKSYGREASPEVLKIAAANVLEEGGSVDQLLLRLGRSESLKRSRQQSASEAIGDAAAVARSSRRAAASKGAKDDGITGEDVVRAVLPETFMKVDPRITEPENFFVGLPENSDPHIAPCCLPVPQEEIVGVVRKSGRLRVHRAGCSEIPWNSTEEPVIEKLDWHEGPFVPIHPAAIVASLANRAGVLGRICNLIGEQNSNISDLLFLERKQKEYLILFEVQVRDCTHLEHVLSAMQTDMEVRFANRCANALLLKEEALKVQ